MDNPIKPQEYFDFRNTFYVGQRISVKRNSMVDPHLKVKVNATITKLYNYFFMAEYDKTGVRECFRYIDALVDDKKCQWEVIS